MNADVDIHWAYPATPSPPAWSWDLAEAASTTLPMLREARLSPDGRSVAGVVTEASSEVWTASLDRGTSTRLTYSSPSVRPVWSADGSEVFYASRRAGGFEIWARPATGGDERRILAREERHVFPSSISRNGTLAFVETGGGTKADIGVLRAGETTPGPLLRASVFDEIAPALSPDGRLLAYQTDESGRWEINVIRLDSGRHSVVSTGGGIHPFWSSDGQALFFEQDAQLMVLPVSEAGDAKGQASRRLSLGGASPVGVAPDGRILLHRGRDAHSRSDGAMLTLQWIQHLRRTMAPPAPAAPR